MRRTCSAALTSFVCGVAVAGAAAPAQAGRYQAIYSFQGGSDGGKPEAGLINVGGTLYGTTGFGGGSTKCSGGCGTVFSLDLTTGAETVVYAFQGGGDGSLPAASLVSVGGKLYGTTLFGGSSASCSSYGCGTVFSVELTTGVEQVVHAFGGAPDGAEPEAGLVNLGGTLYGTTSSGGSSNCTDGCGTVFSLNSKSGVEKVVYSFQSGSDGAVPSAGLLNVGGMLFGTTESGGTSNNGTVFSLDPTSGNERAIYAFQGGADGSEPFANLLDIGGVLYGTTSAGGNGGVNKDVGTVFSLEPATGIEAVVYAFDARSDGAEPAAGLVRVGGNLYGTSFYTVFKLNIASGALQSIHDFPDRNPEYDGISGLIDVGGTLYGTAFAGGSTHCIEGCGMVFAIRP